jgi:heme-degrading monooxygenase HmoA
MFPGAKACLVSALLGPGWGVFTRATFFPPFSEEGGIPMAIKVLIKRRIKEGKTREAFALLNKMRADAMEQPGYISGESLINHDEPREIVVISLWQTIENWLKWKNNRERKANENIFERYLEGPTEYAAYVLGTYPVKKTKRKLNKE